MSTQARDQETDCPKTSSKHRRNTKHPWTNHTDMRATHQTGEQGGQTNLLCCQPRKGQIHPTVQGEHSQHVSRHLTIEFPAKRLKSRKESAENTSICYFCLLGACFIIFTRRHR